MGNGLDTVWARLRVSGVGRAGDSSSPLSHSARDPAGFHSQKLWGFLSSALEPWAGETGVGLGPLAPQEGPLLPRYSS